MSSSIPWIVVLDARGDKTIDDGTSSSPAACNDTLLAARPDAMSPAQTQQLLASAENVMDKTLAVAMNSADLITDARATRLDADARKISASLPCQWW